MTHTPHTRDARGLANMRQDKKRNRARLIAAARELFAERGLDVTMDAVARRAGVGTGTAYRHFANKYELANAIFDDVVDRLVASAEKVAPRSDPWTVLCQTLERMLTVQATNRAIREIILVHNQDEWTHHDALLAPLKDAFDAAKAANAVRADMYYNDLLAMLIMLCSLNEQMGDVAPQLWRRYLPAVLHSLRSAKVPLTGAPIPDDLMRTSLATGLLRHHRT